jgi:4-hydroxy-tetrahydrodipicolinate synthase
MTIDWSGIFHIHATPFTDDAALDLEGVPRLVDAVLATGVRGITILGIAGEAHRLNDEEPRRMRVRPPAAALDPATLDELTELLAAVATS